MKNQALFSSKDKREKLKCRLLQYLFGALRVKIAYTRTVVGGSFYDESFMETLINVYNDTYSKALRVLVATYQPALDKYDISAARYFITLKRDIIIGYFIS